MGKTWEGGGAIDVTWKMFLRVGYFDLGSRVINLIQCLIQFLFM